MQFSRIGEHTIKCIISEEEIYDLGFTMDEIMSNGERTQEFMNHIFDLAEQEFQIKFDLGVKTVRADFLPDHTLSLTFSEYPGVGGMVEHLKDIFNGLLNSIPAEKWEEIKNSKKETLEEKEDLSVIVLFTFDNLNHLVRFAKLAEMYPMPENALYKEGQKYLLMMDLSDCEEEEVMRLSMLTDEFSSGIQLGKERYAYVKEHDKVILRERAVEQLRQL